MASERLLLCGVSTRAAAESAARAGYAVTAIDAFADLDQHQRVTARSVPRDFGRPFTAAAAASVARGIVCDAVAYLSPFENHPRAIETLARGRTLLGNPPGVIARVRDPQRLAEALRVRSLPALRVRVPGTAAQGARESVDEYSLDPGMGAGAAPPGREWLVKPLRSGGGRGVRPWRQGQRVPRGCYLQERAEGIPGSVVFAAARGRVSLLGVTRQLIGESAFGAAGFRYCGNILATDAADSFSGATFVERVSRLARGVAEAFGLVGVNGIDFVVVEGVPYVVEANPRWSASMELVERVTGIPVFEAHARACASGDVPPASMAPVSAAPAVGKAVVYAREEIVVGDTRRWLSDDSVRDVPRPGERVAAGRPICTVFAAGRDAAGCRDALAARAGRVYEEVERRPVAVDRPEF